MYTVHADLGDSLYWAFHECATLSEAIEVAKSAAFDAYSAAADAGDEPPCAIVVCDATMARVHSEPTR